MVGALVPAGGATGSQAPAPGRAGAGAGADWTLLQLLGGFLISLEIARSYRQERSCCNSVDSGKGTGRCCVYLNERRS